MLPIKSLVSFSLSFLWLCCLLRFAVLLPLTGRRFLSGGIAEFHIGLLVAQRLVDVILYRSLRWVDLFSTVLCWFIWENPSMSHDSVYASWVGISSFVEFYSSVKPSNIIFDMVYGFVVVAMSWNLLTVVNDYWLALGLKAIIGLGLPLIWVQGRKRKVKVD